MCLLRPGRRVNATTAIKNLQDKLGLPRPDGSTHLEECLIVSVDSETYNWPCRTDKPLTEGAIAVLDTRKLRGLPTNASNYTSLSETKCHHFRMKESCMLRNGNEERWGANFDHADDFHYGRSELLTRGEVEQLVRAVLMVDHPAVADGLLPVHVVYQGGAEDADRIGEFARPAFDLMKLPSIKREIELQAITPSALPGLKKVGLKTVRDHVELVEEDLHNSGNDAMVQLSAPLQMAITEYRQRTAEDQRPTDDVPIDELLGRLGEHMRETAGPPILGSYEHCFSCGKDGHTNTMQTPCPVRKVGTCKRCLRYNQHITAKCWAGNNGFVETLRQRHYAATRQRNVSLGFSTPRYVPLDETDLCARDHILELPTPRIQETRARQAQQQAEAAMAGLSITETRGARVDATGGVNGASDNTDHVSTQNDQITTFARTNLTPATNQVQTTVTWAPRAGDARTNVIANTNVTIHHLDRHASPHTAAPPQVTNAQVGPSGWAHSGNNGTRGRGGSLRGAPNGRGGRSRANSSRGRGGGTEE